MHYQYEDRSQAGRKVKDQMTSGTNQWALKSVNNLVRGFPGTEYQYLDNAYRPYLITMVTNKPEKGAWTWTTSRFTYDVKRRVTSAERTPSGERWQYAYDDAKSQVTVTDPSGGVSTYSRSAGPDGLC
jgi:YD repeat-containing protein